MKTIGRKKIRNILTVSVFLSLLMVANTCRKDDNVPINKFNVVKYDYTATGTTASITCQYDYNGKIENAQFQYSKTSDMQDILSSSSCTLESNRILNVKVLQLQPNTTYYGCFIVFNGLDNHQTETFAFKTQNYTPASVITSNATNILGNKATLNGRISSEGELSVVERGFCISATSSNPTVSGTHYSAGSGAGSFSKYVTGLNLNTRYYFRAYAKNSNNEYVYGNTLLFTTTDGKPVVTTVSVNSTSSTSVSIEGKVTSDGGFSVTETGFCWATTANPTISNSHVAVGSGTGTYSQTISGLNPGTGYYMRAYARNSNGITYGNSLYVATSSSCPSSVTDYDGNVYATILIGSQCWMRQNLKTTHYQSGTYIPFYSSASDWNNGTSAARCYPNGNSSNVSLYGYLYNWYAVNGGNLCPSGWHVPTDQDFNTLENYLGSNAGGAMKATGYTYWSSPNTGATNSSGFSAYGAGYRSNVDGGYYAWHEYGIFWTSTNYSTYYAIDRALFYDESYLGLFGISDYNYSLEKRSGASVRCLKD